MLSRLPSSNRYLYKRYCCDYEGNNLYNYEPTKHSINSITLNNLIIKDFKGEYNPTYFLPVSFSQSIINKNAFDSLDFTNRVELV